METTTQILEDVTVPEMMSCNSCLGSTDPEYLTYNLAVSGVLLAIVGMVGLIGNILVVKTYLHPEQAIHSTSIYLAALGFSDFFLVLTAMFLFVLEAWRHHDYPTLAYLYVVGAPIIFPVAAVFQTSSVYFCVAAAVDCFIIVVLPQSVRTLYCTPRRAKITCTVLMILCIAYNIPHFFELEKVQCLDEAGLEAMQICPTDIRLDPAYYAIYYTYMYTTFLAIGPLSMLILLNICVVFTVVTKGSANENGEDDTISLILVVFFFIFCNFTALLVNFMEIVFNDPVTRILSIDFSSLILLLPENARLLCGPVQSTGSRQRNSQLFLLLDFWHQFQKYAEKGFF
uniref:G_PROTEIN_RECEP_F1_2 domain-containing protein n=1 Tax=Caenorhabditis japonica TaxID=281687 RepID=A0A8R1DSH0_CAEJA